MLKSAIVAKPLVCQAHDDQRSYILVCLKALAKSKTTVLRQTQQKKHPTDQNSEDNKRQKTEQMP